ncbi:N-acetyltransferase [Occultella glacieicola]|uniref:N-acetyltransferase n=1 Tax=Occultella glacieicola TaxID=2518684 RepID=A0ABY2E064_9MICO|nr:GNAT family N-acetyltransferase [Occultella glacieicola]TDE90802.1 N-acetyltransferase [Occultella glacieicola]
MPPKIRDYGPDDAASWLRCRLLSFFTTEYYDDVYTRRPTYDLPSVQLVADDGGTVVGLLDVAIDGVSSTIESVAVHPDHARSGIASRLLAAALPRLTGARTLDAWTRGDEAANAWYLARGFRENHRYLHVYADDREDDGELAGFAAPEPLSTPLFAFTHARIEHEEAMRRQYRRIHVCRQYLMDLPTS